MGLPSSSTAAGGPQFTRVLDLRPNMLPVNCVFVVLEKGKVERVYDQQATAICYATVADSSAAVTLQLWCAGPGSASTPCGYGSRVGLRLSFRAPQLEQRGFVAAERAEGHDPW
jgi:hypothetical protein